MPTLVVIAYRDETSAATAGEQVQRLVRHLRIQPDAVAVVRRDRDGRCHLSTNHHPVSGEASWGMVWMVLCALLFAPAPADESESALLELVAGGVDERFRAQIRDRLEPGTSALFLALTAGGPDRVVEVLRPYGGEVLRTPVTPAWLAAVQEALHGGLALSAGRDRAPETG